MKVFGVLHIISIMWVVASAMPVAKAPMLKLGAKAWENVGKGCDLHKEHPGVSCLSAHAGTDGTGKAYLPSVGEFLQEMIKRVLESVCGVSGH